MFTEKEVQFVRDVYQSIGREFVHEPRVTNHIHIFETDLNDGESSVLDFDWFSIVRYPVTFEGIGVKRVIRYDVHMWEHYTGHGEHPEICEVELATNCESIQAAVIECLTADARAQIAHQVYDVPLERAFGDI